MNKVQEIPVTGINRRPPKSDFEKIRKACLAARKLFEDPDFPGAPKSVHPTKVHEIFWLRPHEILKMKGVSGDPVFVLEGGTRFDLMQGSLGNCWALASAAAVCETPGAFEWLVPPDQSFDPEWYAGIFRFRFYQYCDWVEIYVDDRLPMKYDGNYFFTHSQNPNVFWGCLLEKAYAKLYGCYDALHGGTNAEALADFTGGLVERYNTHEISNLRRILRKSFSKDTIVAASIFGDLSNPVIDTGLVLGHAYSVTSFGEVTKKGLEKKELLVRVRNPWGTEDEWNGTWSDKSNEWNRVTDGSREQLELVKAADGEFWMSVSDFKWHFDSITLCNCMPDDVESNDEKNWKVAIYHGEFKKSETDGGLQESEEMHNRAKQYLIKVEDHDEDGVASVVIQITQKHRRKLGAETHPIGSMVLKRPEGVPVPIPFEVMDKLGEEATAGAMVSNSREETKRFDLDPGEYVIMLTTMQPDTETEYMLRIFSEAPLNDCEIK